MINLNKDYSNMELKYGNIDYINRYISGYAYAVKKYYRENYIYLKRPNPLINLIESIELDMTTDIVIQVNNLINTLYYRARQQGFITKTDHNTYLKDVIIKNNKEYFLVTTDLDITINEHNYLNYSPIKVLYTTLDDMINIHPLKYENAIEDIDYSCYKIELGNLILLYYYWYKDRLKNQESIDASEFLSQIIFTNLINQYNYFSSFTRMMKINEDRYVNNWINMNPFHIPDPTKWLDKYVEWFLKEIKKKSFLSPIDIFYNFEIEPMLYNNVIMDNYYYTRTNKWFYWLYITPYLIFLSDVLNKKHNKAIFKEIEREIKLDERSKIFDINDVIPNMNKEILKKRIKS